MSDPTMQETDRSASRRAAWCFAKASRDLAEARSKIAEPVDVDRISARLRELDPADQRAVGAFIEAYHELSRVLTGIPGPDQDETVADAFAQIARLLLAEQGVERTLSKIGALAVQTIDGCDHAGISLIEKRRVTTAGASDEVATKVDKIQHEVDQGPCLDAIRQHEVFLCGRLAEEERWPAFSHRAAAETGISSMLAFRLFADEDTMGALNLYSRTPDAFDDESKELGSVFAAHAAVALSSARKEEQLNDALASRDVIGQAKGILMARQDITSDEAFEVLRKASQRLNVKLRDMADRLVSANEPAQQS